MELRLGRKKREPYVELAGVIGPAHDYNVYRMLLREKAVGYLLGFAAGLVGMQIMFGELIASILLGAVIGFFTVPLYRNYLHKKQKRLLLLQFRDLLDSLSNSFSSGKHYNGAFADALKDLRTSYGEDGMITKEIADINSGLASSFNIEELLENMALRCGLSDVRSFVDTFIACREAGSDLRKVVKDARDIINDKIEIEMEIQTTLTSNKNEINILSLMPFVIVSMMGMIGEAAITDNSPLNIIVKLIALSLFAVSYALGRKITDIKV